MLFFFLFFFLFFLLFHLVYRHKSKNTAVYWNATINCCGLELVIRLLLYTFLHKVKHITLSSANIMKSDVRK